MSRSLEGLIIDVKESLEREIHSLGENVNLRLDAQAARSDRQWALINAGSRWTAQINEMSERLDASIDRRDKRQEGKQ